MPIDPHLLVLFTMTTITPGPDMLFVLGGIFIGLGVRLAVER
ncbi:hypothetical protein ACQEVF_02470 [Nonomuraea polychroma]